MDYYDDIDVHRRMVADTIRTDAFRHSIHAVVKTGDVVLDVGSGSGILSLFAAQAGAARVLAVERAPAAVALARELVRNNGFADRIEVIEADAGSLSAVAAVDVIVSEWLGVFGIDENMLPPVLIARDRWLKPGGTMIPGVTTAWLAPAHSASGEAAIAFHDSAYALDLSALAPFDLNEALWLPDGADADDLKADAQPLWSTDPSLAIVADVASPFAKQLTFEIEGPVNVLVAWFSAEMPGSDALCNHPASPSTHWGNFAFPIAVAAGAHGTNTLHVDFHCVPVAGSACEFLWSARLNEGPRETHDTRRPSRPPGVPPWRIDMT